jgi:pimeloyl-ACP methyl ester carboxylesterase
MPLNLAFFDADAALAVMIAYPDIEQWAVGGHSLGGSMAAKFAYDHPDEVAGLVLWAAYPAASNDLSNLDQLEAVSIYGSNDGLSTPTDIENTQNLLPPHVELVEITGGNHAQFGWYGPQDRDNPADISRIEQQAQVVQATLDLLNRL